PPLRERTEDIPTLVKYFLQRSGTELNIQNVAVQSNALEFLQAQPWPGNVRELENVIRQALLLSRGYPISLDHVRRVTGQGPQSAVGDQQSVSSRVARLLASAKAGEIEGVHARMIEEVERELFTQAIRAAQGNQAKAARWLGVSRVTIREKLHH